MPKQGFRCIGFCLLTAASIGVYSSVGTAVAANSPVATIILLNGKVFKQAKGAKTPTPAKKDDRLEEGTVLTTEERSFAKLLFVDNSQMNVGPKSSMQIERYRKNEAGLVKLIDGQIRAKITKELLNQGDTKPENKLLLRTKTAALGVRGTDFQVTYSDANGSTSLVTFESQVAMVNFSSEQTGNYGELMRTMTESLASDAAVLVGEGQFSAASRAAEAPMPAVRISPDQLESLKKNETMVAAPPEGTSNAQAANYVSPIPPGVDATKFVASADVGKALESALGANAARDMVRAATEAQRQAAANAPASSAQGPLAGGYVDLSRGVYVAPDPSKGAIFDPVTKLFIPDPSVKVSAGGELIVQKGVEISATGQVTRTEPAAGPVAARTPSSVTSSTTAAAPEVGASTASKEPDINDLDEQDEEDAEGDLAPETQTPTDTNVNFQITVGP